MHGRTNTQTYLLLHGFAGGHEATDDGADLEPPLCFIEKAYAKIEFGSQSAGRRVKLTASIQGPIKA